MTTQSSAEGLRQQIEELDVDFGYAVGNLAIDCVDNTVDAIMELVAAYAATVEREAETTGALNVLELLAKDGTISEKVKLKMLDTVFEWSGLAALQGPEGRYVCEICTSTHKDHHNAQMHQQMRSPDGE